MAARERDTESALSAAVRPWVLVGATARSGRYRRACETTVFRLESGREARLDASCASVARCDTRTPQTIAPKLKQGVIAAVNDYYTARLAAKLFDSPLHGQVAVSGGPSSPAYPPRLRASPALLLLSFVLQWWCDRADILKLARDSPYCGSIVEVALDHARVRFVWSKPEVR